MEQNSPIGAHEAHDSVNTNKTYNIIIVILSIVITFLLGYISYGFVNGNDNGDSNTETQSESQDEIERIDETESEFETESEMTLKAEEPESTIPSQTTETETIPTIKSVQVILAWDIPGWDEIIQTHTTTRSDVLTFAIETLISESDSEVVGESNCGGKDFQIVSITGGLATIQFCKTVRGFGGMGDIAYYASIVRTARQFSNIDRVIVLDVDGKCLFDHSGWNTCMPDGWGEI